MVISDNRMSMSFGFLNKSALCQFAGELSLQPALQWNGQCLGRFPGIPPRKYVTMSHAVNGY